MGVEYKIRFTVPNGYDPSAFLNKLPSPIHRATMNEIYNYKICKDGFYFIGQLVNEEVTSVAFKRFVNEALCYSRSVEIVEP